MDNVVRLRGARLELYSLGFLSTACSVFFVRLLYRLFFTLVPKGLTFFCRISRAVKNARFIPIWIVVWTACIISLTLSSVTLIGVFCEADPTNFFSTVTSTVGIYLFFRIPLPSVVF